MRDRYLISGLKAAMIAVPLWLIFVLAKGEISWRLALVGVIIFIVLWIINTSRAPRRYDTPPSPDEWWWNKW